MTRLFLLTFLTVPACLTAFAIGMSPVMALADKVFVATDDPAVAPFLDDLDEIATARTQLELGDYAPSVPVVRERAEAGNPWAQNLMATLYSGNGDDDLVPDDMTQAMAWYERSAQQGFPLAMHNLGVNYRDGIDGAAPQMDRAAEWFGQAADAGYAELMAELALILFGDPSQLQDARARDLLDAGLAIKPDLPLLRSILADTHYLGRSRPVDYAAALPLYEDLADAGDLHGQMRAGEIYYYGLGVEVDVVRARQLFEAAAAQDDAEAYAFLAEIYIDGYGVTPDPARAMEYATESDRLGDGWGAYHLGWLLRHGIGAGPDYDRARAAFARAIERGHGAAVNDLADMAYFGEGEVQDYAKAFEMFERRFSEAPDDIYAAYSVAYMQMRGEGTEANIPAARDILEQVVLDDGYDIATSRIELAVIYGHPDFAGAWSDPVRGMAQCLALRAADALAAAPVTDDGPVACAHLDASVDAAQMTAARDLAASFRTN